MTEHDQQRIQQWLSGELDAAEMASVAQWVASDPAASAERDAQRTLQALVAGNAPGPFAPHFADRVMAQLPSGNDRPARPGAAARPLRTRIRWAVPAVMLVVLAAGWWAWRQAVPADPFTVLTAPAGAVTQFTLPDGTRVDLAPGSTLRMAAGLDGDARRVELSGEAFFAVTRDARPFEVQTFNAEVVVLGTQFNVRAWPDERTPETAVAVAEGRVRLQPRAPSDIARSALATAPGVDLTAGRASRVRADTTATLPVDDALLDRALAWRSGGLAFQNQPLADVFQALDRRFALHIAAASPAIAARRLTYHDPEPGSAEEVLADISQTLGLRYRRTATGYTVTAR